MLYCSAFILNIVSIAVAGNDITGNDIYIRHINFVPYLDVRFGMETFRNRRP